MNDLPSTWLETNLGTVVPYGTTVKAEPEEIAPDTWVLELEDIEKDSTKVLQRLSFKERQSKSTKNRFDAGDVLYGKLRPYLNKVVYADRPGVCTTEIVPIKPNDTVDGRYLFHWLRHPQFLTYVTEVSHGVNMPRLGTEAGKQAPFVLAPKNEQTRIADKLDTVLGRVDALNARLARVAPLLKRFRQSVLAAATSGRLTEDWRHYPTVKDSWQASTIGDLANVVRGASPRPAGDLRFFGGSTPWITVGELTKDESKYLVSTSNFLTQEGREKSRIIKSGTLLLTNSGATLGVPKITAIEGCINDGSVALLDLKEPLKQYLYWFLKSQTEVLRNLNRGAAQPNLNTGIVKAIQLCLPPEKEQSEIVRRVETLFAFADRLEARLQAARTAAERLTPSLLAKAFRGELVPQDPADEPAAELLKRLAASTPASPKRRGRPAKTA